MSQPTASSSPSGRLPRARCDLCGGSVVWVEQRATGKRAPIDPEPVDDHTKGNLARVNPALVGGKTNVVEVIPEPERWMVARLYVSHHATCEAWQRCRADGLTMKECKDRCNHQRMTPVLNQSARETMSPQGYQREGTHRV